MELSQAWQSYSCFYISTLDIVTSVLDGREQLYIIGECNRTQPFRFMVAAARSAHVVWKERPDVVVTTGSLPMAILCLFAKLCGAKIIWIDSIANVDVISASGRFVRRFADLFITQWEHLAQGNESIEYAGTVT